MMARTGDLSNGIRVGESDVGGKYNKTTLYIRKEDEEEFDLTHIVKDEKETTALFEIYGNTVVIADSIIECTHEDDHWVSIGVYACVFRNGEILWVPLLTKHWSSSMNKEEELIKIKEREAQILEGISDTYPINILDSSEWKAIFK